IGFKLARSKLKDPQTIVVGAPPPPQRATLPLALAPISRKLHLGRVRGLSRKTIEVPRASKKQSPPVRGIGSGIPSTLSQQLTRESMAKCAKSVGDIFLSEGVTFSSVCFSCFTPHGAVASSLCRPKAVTCIVLRRLVGHLKSADLGECMIAKALCNGTAKYAHMAGQASMAGGGSPSDAEGFDHEGEGYA